MHSDELDIDAALVARLIAAQFPQWADLPIVKAPSAGTDHAMYRLADDMVVRLPRIPGAARQVDKEALSETGANVRWLIAAGCRHPRLPGNAGEAAQAPKRPPPRRPGTRRAHPTTTRLHGGTTVPGGVVGRGPADTSGEVRRWRNG